MKEWWPFGVALRGVASNRLVLRWLKTVVVSDRGKPDVIGQLLSAGGACSRNTKTARNRNAGLGVATVADRIAQTVVATRLEKAVEPVFHPDSYGYVCHERREEL